MSNVNSTAALELLNLELDDRLAEADREELDALLEDHPEARRERDELAHLNVLLQQSQSPVRQGFRDEVMASLPAAGWEAAHPWSWRWAGMLMVLLGGASAVMLGIGSARALPQSSFLGAFAAVGDLFVSTSLAGAGLLAASWKGLGLALADLLAQSRGSIIALIVLTVSLNGFFLVLLRASRRALLERANATRDQGNG